MPALGDLEAGTVASLTSVRFSVASGDLACVAAVAVLTAAQPVPLAYDARLSKQAREQAA